MYATNVLYIQIYPSLLPGRQFHTSGRPPAGLLEALLWMCTARSHSRDKFQQVNRLLQECRCQHGQCSLGFYKHLGRNTMQHMHILVFHSGGSILVCKISLGEARRASRISTLPWKQRIRTFGQYHFGCVHTAAD